MSPQAPARGAERAPRGDRRRFLAAIGAAAGLAWQGRAGGAEAAKTHRVVIRGLKYQPETLVVRRGDAVVWVNDDPMPHTVTSRRRFRFALDRRGPVVALRDEARRHLPLRLHPALEHARPRCRSTDAPRRAGRLGRWGQCRRYCSAPNRISRALSSRAACAVRPAPRRRAAPPAARRSRRTSASDAGYSFQSMPWFFQERSHGKIAMSAIV